MWLILVGIFVGLIARWATGEGDPKGPRRFETPANQIPKTIDPNSLERIEIDLPLESSLVPPIRIPGRLPTENAGVVEPLDFQTFLTAFDRHAHDSGAVFHAHGEEICASGCAASRHPTAELTEGHYRYLIADYGTAGMNEDNAALEELLYFGPQTEKLINRIGYLDLDRARATFLRDELKHTHARISIRLIDENGEVQSWIDPTSVPLDRRHVFKMEHQDDLQPLVTSGTVKRVGLNHLWTRL